MNAIIPIAGKGTRTYPLSFATPKPLLRIKGKPILYYVLDVLKDFDVKEIIYVISKNMEESWNEIKNLSGIESVYVLQEEAKGLGDAVLKAKKY